MPVPNWLLPAFSIMIADFLYLQSALPFGTDFSPQNWEPARRLIKILAPKLYQDESLQDKHHKHLDQLQCESSLGTQTQPFVPAKACTQAMAIQYPRLSDSLSMTLYMLKSMKPPERASSRQWQRA